MSLAGLIILAVFGAGMGVWLAVWTGTRWPRLTAWQARWLAAHQTTDPVDVAWLTVMAMLQGDSLDATRPAPAVRACGWCVPDEPRTGGAYPWEGYDCTCGEDCRHEYCRRGPGWTRALEEAKNLMPEADAGA